MNTDIFLFLCFLGAIYFPITYLILSFKYRSIKPSNDYDKRIFKESKDNSKKYLPLVIILSLYFILSYYPKNFFKITSLKEENIIITDINLHDPYEDLLSEETNIYKDKDEKILDLLKSISYKKPFFKPYILGNSILELRLNSKEDPNDYNTYVSIRDGRYIQVTKPSLFNLETTNYYKIKKSINISDEIFKILE